ncbi:hypothetical protein Btru_067907 [Bulinus truncatus]|nr:hypothetical protein Btru_067907 [Bulinus truncatus]
MRHFILLAAFLYLLSLCAPFSLPIPCPEVDCEPNVHGCMHATDSNGCETCLCACLPVMCSCNGDVLWSVDANGCPRCRCKQNFTQ